MTASAQAAVRDVAPWIEILARVGYAAKAVLYGTIGFLAARAAFGWDGGRATDTRGALRAVRDAPFGRHILLVIAAGLAGYGLWRLVEAVTDPEHRGTRPKGVAIRAGNAVRGLAHGALALAAFRLGLGSGGARSQGPDGWTARALALPAGEVLVWVGAAAVAGYGVYQLYRAWKAKLGRHLALNRVSAGTGSVLVAVCRFGLAARGAVFGLIGFLLGRAAARHDPGQAGGVRESLLTMAGFGRWALAAAGIGLVAYGVYQLVEARYRRIDVA
ncbi:MAG TPA: DUF1206 domain-containing protein [Gemmatimonadales bacterium]|nr:DUF1206 domain-containing protein [Gemmatimonadales bacterium]